MAQAILKASAIITVDGNGTRAEAVAFDVERGTVLCAGSLADCRAAAPDAEIEDLGSSTLLPGFVDAHSHPVLGGVLTQEPAHWIAPYMGYPTWSAVEAYFDKVHAEKPTGEPQLFTGFDRPLQGAPLLTLEILDRHFPDRPVVVLDNCGHLLYFNTAVMKLNGWDKDVPEDPVAGSYGRNADGSLVGTAYETPAVMGAARNVIAQVVTHPLHSAAKWFALMGRNGVTLTSDHAFDPTSLSGYEALVSFPDCPIRVGFYEMSIDQDPAKQITTSNPSVIWKQGIKVWADGSPLIGSAGLSFPYLDNETTRTAQIPLGPFGEKNMNYTRAELDAMLDELAPTGWQMTFHCNGDVSFDVILDACEAALARHDLLGTDHRWRIEHCGAARADQFDRAASLGLHCSLGPFQFIYWGDLFDGTLFDAAVGSQWQRFADAWKAGVHVSLHNDGPVDPPLPLLNLQAVVTRTTASGAVHGVNQALTMDQAIRAHTINGARQLGHDQDLGSIEVGKLADFVELSADPTAADPHELTERVHVKGTWIGGHKIDLAKFEAAVEKIDPAPHRTLATLNRHRCC